MSRGQWLLVALVAAATGCADSEDELAPGDPAFVRDPALDVELHSVPGENRSHRRGENCMHCHQPLGPGLGRFTIGVTVRTPTGFAVDPIVELYDGPPDDGGALVTTLRGDAMGNVFTTEAFGLPDRELWPKVWSADRALTNQMPFPTGSGACNLCHKRAFEVTVVPPVMP